MGVKTVTILGVNIGALDMPLALSKVAEWIDSHEAHYVCVAPAHSIMECVNDSALLPIFNGAGMVTPDGMAVVWLARLKGYREVERVYGPDLLLAACEYGLERGWRHYFYGGAPGVAQALAKSLQERFPGLQVAGICSPPFGRPTPVEERPFLDQLNTSKTDIVWIGMSSPRQETWMCEHLGQVNAPVMVGVGAAFDFLSGRKPQAPRWMQRAGLEWFFRFASEPQRLWPRYRQYPRFLFLAIKELFSEQTIRSKSKL